jgi:hypothetical protein
LKELLQRSSARRRLLVVGEAAGVDGNGELVPVGKGVFVLIEFCAEHLVLVEGQHQDPALLVFCCALLLAVSPHDPLYDIYYDADDKDYCTQ